MKKFLTAIAGIGAMGLVSGANASLIDFTDADVISGTLASPQVINVDGVEITITSNIDPLNFTDSLADNSAPFCATFGFACEQDGLGIVDDEVGPGEFVTLTFDRAVNITALSFLDLFFDAGGSEDETVLLQVNGGATMTFDALEPYIGATNGFARFDLVPDLGAVLTLTFLVGDGNDGVGVRDYAIAGVEFTPVPIPAAGLLFGSVIAGGIAARRRKLAKS